MLGEVEVTANKMSENLKNIPQSVSVVDAGEFEERHVKNVEDLVKTIPNINANGGIYEGISSRGLNPSIFTGSNPVALYVGGSHRQIRTHLTFLSQMSSVSRFCAVQVAQYMEKTASVES